MRTVVQSRFIYAISGINFHVSTGRRRAATGFSPCFIYVENMRRMSRKWAPSLCECRHRVIRLPYLAWSLLLAAWHARRKLPRAHTMHAWDASVQLRNAIASKHCATLIEHYNFLVASVAIHVCSGSVFDVAIKYCRALQSVQNRIKISANLTPPLRRRILNGERGFMTDRNWRQEW